MAGVCVVGSINLDLVARTARHPRPGETLLGFDYSEHAGGKGLNQAVAAARSGASTQLIAAVGEDDAGVRLLGIATAEGIDVDSVSSHAQSPTGRAVIVVDDNAENSIVVVPGANQFCPVLTEVSKTVVLAQLEVPVTSVLESFRAARRAGAITILNPAPAAALPPELLELCDVIVPNEHEIDILGGAEPLLAAGVSTIIVTLGSHGIDLIDAAGTRHIDAHDVEPVDTTGAGDAFCGCLAAGLAAGLTIDAASGRAIIAGALATTRHGAVPSLPTQMEIDREISRVA